ncbi:coiled-coil-containing protein [Legionella busanensis]|uniref:Coiled-coil-containing protein n=1 Tax=Legionella busanensis TaxID=190655 RepID=A0A378JLS4_9GAMM|nr:hypothetical protein [Legionella busanensis]STX52165.1 coiled-coil-containing protein [Legionella busanensis]
MKVNGLYSTLQYKLAQQPDFKLKNQIIPHQDVTLNNKNYYRLALPVNQFKLSENWLLNEAHLSIYEELDHKNPVLGPSHFTAIWENKEGAAYRLHIFLDNNDVLACHPTWDYIDASGQFIKAEMPAELESLVQIVLQLGLPYLQQLRQEQGIIVQSLEAENAKLEKTLQQMSANLPQNQALYLEQVAKIKPILNELYQITSHVKWYRLQNYFNKFARALINQFNTETVSSTDDREDFSEPKSTPESSIQNSSNLQKTSKNQKIVEPKLLFNEILAIYKNFSRLKQEEDQINLINILNNKINLFDLNNWILSFAEIEKLKQIETDIEKTAFPLLQTALVTNQFEKAQSLQSFYYLLNSNIYAFSLKQRNFKLLDFLIKNLHIPVNNYKFMVVNIDYPNALTYCMQERNKDSNLINCFAELIKGGGNLMLPISTGQAPIAHIILSSQPTHPLYSALENTANLTLDNKAFYQRLISAMQAYKKQVTDRKELIKIDKAISIYQQMLNDISLSKQLFNSSTRKTFRELGQIVTQITSSSLITQLQLDPDIINAKSRMEMQVQMLLQKFKRNRRNHLNLPINSILQADFKKIQENLLTFEQIDCDYEELKEAALNNFQLMAELFNEIDNLFDITQELRSKGMFIGKRNKQVHQLIRNKEEAESNIKSLVKQLPLNILKELDLPADKELAEILKQAQDLQAKLANLNQQLNKFGFFNKETSSSVVSTFNEDKEEMKKESELSDYILS